MVKFGALPKRMKMTTILKEIGEYVIQTDALTLRKTVSNQHTVLQKVSKCEVRALPLSVEIQEFYF